MTNLPGRPFVTGHTENMATEHYFYTTQVMGLELIGEPTDQGYTTDHLVWWHEAEAPFRGTDLKPGDPCSIELAGFQLVEQPNVFDRGGFLYKNHFDSLDELIGYGLMNSTVCTRCGFHIYIRFGEFIDTERSEGEETQSAVSA